MKIETARHAYPEKKGFEINRPTGCPTMFSFTFGHPLRCTTIIRHAAFGQIKTLA